jgi:hypothetical protein
VARKIIMIVVALLVPGGLIALFGAWMIRLFQRSRNGRTSTALARRGVLFGAGASRQAA